MLSPCQAKAHGADLGISPRQRRKKRKESLAFSSPRSGKKQVDIVKAPERNDRAEKKYRRSALEGKTESRRQKPREE